MNVLEVLRVLQLLSIIIAVLSEYEPLPLQQLMVQDHSHSVCFFPFFLVEFKVFEQTLLHVHLVSFVYVERIKLFKWFPFPKKNNCIFYALYKWWILTVLFSWIWNHRVFFNSLFRKMPRSNTLSAVDISKTYCFKAQNVKKADIA